MSDTSSAFTEVPAGGINTPSESIVGSISDVHSGLDVLSIADTELSQVAPKSPTKVRGILNGNFAAIDGRISNGTTIDRSIRNPTMTEATIKYEFASYPRIDVRLTFGFSQEPIEWHKVTSHVPDLTALIQNTVESMANSEGGAAKLLLVLIFSQAYYDACPDFWKRLRLEAAEQLFSFVGAPDVYHLTIRNIHKCLGTAIKTSYRVSGTGESYYDVSANGSILWLNEHYRGSVRGKYGAGHCLGLLPELKVCVL